MQELLVIMPELPLLTLVLLAAVVFRTVRRYIIGACLGLAAAIVIGVFAHEALDAATGRCIYGEPAAIAVSADPHAREHA